ncbi:P-loop containing nucleoside triphosphate hydrolase protein [Paraphysoderma sedebokerense]|nr:P-loop containing nucleoside triphosphate hydrolase protein [Paraphysoderma sedebokerense]
MNRERYHLPYKPATTDLTPKLKILSLGDPNVGKSCLIKRYCEGKFVQKYISTIGIDYGLKSGSIHGIQVKLNFWDSAGAKPFFHIRNEFYKDTHGILLVYDVTSKASFNSLDSWIDEFTSVVKAQGSKVESVVYLIANKTDLSPRVITEQEGRAYAQKKHLKYFEASASTGLNIPELFDDMFQAILTKFFPKKENDLTVAKSDSIAEIEKGISQLFYCEEASLKVE